MALSNKEHQRNFVQRRKQEKAMGIQRAVFMLPQETTTQIDALAGFYELKQEEVITRAIRTMWQDRLVISPTFIKEPRTVKVADDQPAAEPEPEHIDPIPTPTTPLNFVPPITRKGECYGKGKYRPGKPLSSGIIEALSSDPANPDQAENGSASKGIG